MQTTSEQQSFGLAEFLTVTVLAVAVLAAAVMWNRHRPMSTVQLDGWDVVASQYRDSVAIALSTAVKSGAIERLADAERLVERFPFVRSATARRIGATLAVTVVERQPLALVQLGNDALGWLTVDSTLIQYGAYYRRCDVPLLAVPDGRRALRMVPVLGTLSTDGGVYSQCSEIGCDSQGNVSLRLAHSATNVLLGTADDLGSKLERLAFIVRSPWLCSGVRSIDLRWQNRIVLSATNRPISGKVSV
jgi:hypothetical protein